MNETWWVDPSKLDSDQLNVIDLSIDENQLLSGPPGSGKTNLLLLKGNQFVLEGRANVRILAFTRALKEFIAGGSKQYQFDSSYVVTINAFMMEFLRSERVAFTLMDDFDKDRAMLIRLCREHTERKKYKGVFNAIIVDEGQDCLPEEVSLLSQLAETLLVATDIRQQLYGNKSVMDAWHDVIPVSNRHTLQNHYRNGQKICQVADAITPTTDDYRLLPFSMYDEVSNPTTVKVHLCDSLNKQVDLMLQTVKGELRAYPDEGLGVLCGNRATLLAARDILQNSDIADNFIFHVNEGDGYNSFDPEKRIFFGTINSGKGLEFRTVHILGAESIPPFSYRELCYTAVTRAKTALAVYHSARLSPLLASALNVVAQKKAPTPVADLFGRRKP